MVKGVIRARAPLRLGLAGGGTDLSPFCDEFGGAVINATIDRYAFASFAPRTDGAVVFEATDIDKVDACDAGRPIDAADGLRLHRGVYNRMVRDFADGRPQPMSIVTNVESPLGSGLGSSSALVVALVTLLAEVFSAPLGEYEIAHLAYEIERLDLQLQGGRQDQYAAAFGGFNFIEFGADDRVVVNPLRIGGATIYELESSLVLYFTGASRQSAAVIDDQVRNVREGGSALEAMHLLKQEAVTMKEALLFGRIGDVARIMQRGWEAKRATSSVVSNADIERVFDAAMNAGALGGKVSGAGGGGFLMFVVDPLRRAAVMSALDGLGSGFVTSARFTSEGAISWRPR
jgi:D-glycero-alpha-D-manno-heptose-7-phosphate kinase